MSRGSYTAADRRQELETAELLAQAWDLELVPMARDVSAVDFAAMRRGELVGFIEVRRKRQSSTDYGFVWLDLHKLRQMRALEELVAPTVFVAHFDDVVLWLPMAGLELDEEAAEITGRRSRRTPFDGSEGDEKPALRVPIDLFRKVE